MNTILVPVDLSAVSRDVCNAACALARPLGARLLLLHVVPPLSYMMTDYYAFDSAVMTDAIAASEERSRLRLAELVAQCATQGLTAEAVQGSGNPATEILAKAAAAKAAYIVLGSHGHGAVYNLLIGSTAQGVLRKALCPVVVVPVAGNA